MFQIGKRAGWLQLFMHNSFGIKSLDLVIDGREFLVLGIDQLRGFFGHMRIFRQYDRDRLTDMANLV